MDNSFRGNGKIIGYLERALIYVFVIVDASSSIGFLIVAKSIYPFTKNSKEEGQAIAQYIIIGTLASFVYAVTTAHLVRLCLLSIW